MSVFSTYLNINRNTVCVYTSFPNYPYGTVDPIAKIAGICKSSDTPLHIDMCLGGYLVPFLKTTEGSPYFTVPSGVTSISLDCHKYGLAAKGASVLLFSSEKYRKEQLFVTSEWPGGLYGTVGIAGSRTGATIASAWISMMRLGVNGYTKNANAISSGT
jgi:sphinganine-1-phosphate aldolase